MYPVRCACGVVGLLLAALGNSWAAEEPCPEQAPSALNERRALAGTWFRRGESALDAGDAVSATRAFWCSLRMTPHAATAFNLSNAAERAGDLELAVEASRRYLALAPPDAAERAAVQERLERVQRRLAALAEGRKETNETTKGNEAPAPRAQGAPAAATARAISQAPPPPANRALRVAGWSGVGVAAVALGAGVFLNLGARRALEASKRLAPGDREAAGAEWDRARSRRTMSYAALGLGAAGLTGGAVLLLLGRSSPEENPRLSLLLGQGGGSVGYQGRF